MNKILGDWVIINLIQNTYLEKVHLVKSIEEVN